MSIENVTTALQVNATTGNGVTTLVLPEPRLVTFKITGQRISHGWRNYYRVLPPK